MKTHYLTKIMAKEMMEETINTIGHKKEKMMTKVMVAPIEAMDNRHLWMNTFTTARNNNNNITSHNTKREKLEIRLT